MAVNLYSISIPMYIKHLNSLADILTKAEEYAKNKNIPEADIMNAKLAPDMRPLVFQVQVATNTAKAVLTRVAGYEAVPMEDNESSFAELQSRITATVKLLKEAKEADFEGKQASEVVLTTQKGDQKFTGTSYLLNFALPNFYFHYTTAYAILRNLGVEIGKRDYLRNT